MNKWYWEGNVQNVMKEYLRTKGWKLLASADTRRKEKGIDIHAQKSKKELYVEVKGYPKDNGRTKPSNQASKWFDQAISKALVYRSKHPNAEVALCFPKCRTYVTKAESIKPVLKKISIQVFFVD